MSWYDKTPVSYSHFGQPYFILDSSWHHVSTPRHRPDSLIKHWDLFPLLGLLRFRSQEPVTPRYHRSPTLTSHKDHHIWTTRILVPSTDLFRQPPTSLIRFYSYCDQPLVKPGRRCYPINPQGCTISLVHNLTHWLAFDKSIGTSRHHCLSLKRLLVYYIIFHSSSSSLIFSLPHCVHESPYLPYPFPWSAV